MPRIITYGLIFLIFVSAAIFVVIQQGSFLSMMVLGAAVGIAFLLKPQALLIAAIASGPMELLVPRLAGVLKLQHLLFMGLIAYGILDASLRKERKTRTRSVTFLVLFGLWMCVIIYARGIGFRFLGSEAFGGMDYVKIFLAIGALWGGVKIPMTPRQTRILLTAYALGALVPFTTQLVILAVPNSVYILNRFIETRAEYLFSAEELYGLRGLGGSVYGRIHAAGAVATGLWLLAWAKWGLPNHPHHYRLFLALPLLAILSLQSGFRGNFANFVFLGGLMLFVTSRRKGVFVTASAATGLALYVLLIAVGPNLPPNVQRTLSFIPGVNWEREVLVDATQSVDWRIRLWKYAAQYIPRYWLIGRGLLLEDVYRVHAWRDWTYYSSEDFFYASHAYHSGPLSLLLDTGVIGLILFLLFQVHVIREGWNYWQRASGVPADPFLKSALLYLCIRVNYMLFVYYFLYGDLKYNIVDWVVMALLVHHTGRGSVGQPEPIPAPSHEPMLQRPAAIGGPEWKDWKLRPTASPAR